MSKLRLTTFFFIISSFSLFAQQKSESGIRHTVVISGPKTLELNERDEIVWEYEDNSRDITKLKNGNYLITYATKVVEVSPSKKVIWSYEININEELMSSERLANGRTLITELGNQPRLVEVNRKGKIKKIIPIQPETTNIHMQSRMARKLSKRRYIVPHRLMPFVKEYNKHGKVMRTFRVDIPELGGTAAKNGTFAAIRLKNGSTVVTCASGNRMVVFDKTGKVNWQLTTSEIDGQLQDVCGLQVLKNGNFLVSCYGNQAADGLKMIEITRDKKMVWSYQNPTVRYVHTVQVLTTNGQKE